MKKFSTLTISIVLFSLCSSAVVAENLAAGNAALGVLLNSSTDGSKCGDPAANRIKVPMPINPGIFCEPMQISLDVRFVGGDAEEAKNALFAKLQDLAAGRNFEVVELPQGVKPPVGSAVFYINVKKSVGEVTSSYNSSSTDSWGGFNRHGSNNQSSASSSSGSWQSTIVDSTTSGSLKLVGPDGILTGMSAYNLVYSGNSELTGSSHQDSASYNYNYSNRRDGYASGDTNSSGSTYSKSPSVSADKSSAITLDEATEKLAYRIIADGIDFFNNRMRIRGEAKPTEEAQAPTVTTSSQPSTPVMIYTGAADYNIDQ